MDKHKHFVTVIRYPTSPNAKLIKRLKSLVVDSDQTKIEKVVKLIKRNESTDGKNAIEEYARSLDPLFIMVGLIESISTLKGVIRQIEIPSKPAGHLYSLCVLSYDNTVDKALLNYYQVTIR